MNRTDRLLAIVLELQHKGRQRAEDLAETFETCKRTIYRDIQALCEAGVPLISIPGQGYSLMKGYFLPPLSFTAEEATMLLLGSDFMAPHFDAQYRSAALSAHRKIAGVLPEHLRDDVDYLQHNIQFIPTDSASRSAEHALLQQLRRALIECITVRFRYHARHRNEHDSATLRDANPYRLACVANTWYLVAYCHLRRDIRNFRLDRIADLELLPQNFQRPLDLENQLREHRQNQVGAIVVCALFDREVMRWVREARSYYTVGEEETPEGLRVTLRVRQESDVLQWLLGWGRHVRVLEPDTLRERLADEADAMRQNHTMLPK